MNSKKMFGCTGFYLEDQKGDSSLRILFRDSTKEAENNGVIFICNPEFTENFSKKNHLTSIPMFSHLNQKKFLNWKLYPKNAVHFEDHFEFVLVEFIKCLRSPLI